MHSLLAKARPVLCALIVVAFFIPSYREYSALQFLSVAFDEANKDYNMTQTDAFILVTPLVLVPVSAFFLFFLAVLRISTRQIYTGLPLLFLVFFSAILFSSEQSIVDQQSGYQLLSQVQAGFYVAGLSSVLLLFTKNRKKRRHRRKRSRLPEPELAA